MSERFYVVHLIDGTYELFRHFYGLRRLNKGVDRPYGAVVGVLQSEWNAIQQSLGCFENPLKQCVAAPPTLP